MKKIITILTVFLLTTLLITSVFNVSAVDSHIKTTAGYDEDYDDTDYEDDDDYDDNYDDEDDNEDEDDDDYDDDEDDDDDYDDDEDADDDYDDDDDDYDDDEDDDDKIQYDDSVEGTDPTEKETSYTTAEKSIDENNFIAYQYCGNRLNWYIKNFELVIFGQGEMYDYDNPEDAPWYGKSYTKITIRHGVTTISDNAFFASKARIVTIPSSVVEIGRYAFANADSLKRVALGKDMISVDEHAFYNCTNLSQVTLNNNLSKIGVSAFENCSSLVDIRLPKTLKYISVNAFKGCSSMCSVILRNSQLEIKESAFENCSGLKNINMPDSFTSIHSSAFRNCTRLSFDNLPANLITIGDYAFEKCSFLSDITLPNKLTEVGTGAFKNSGVKNLTVNGSLKYFDINMLSGCNNVIINVKCNSAAYNEFKKVIGYTVNCIQHDNTPLTKCKATFTKDGILSGYVCKSCGEKTNYKAISHISAVILKSSAYAYTGKPVQPNVTVYSANGKTISSKNYTITYADKRIDIGKKNLKVKFKGDYSGTKTLYYTIIPQKPVTTTIKAKKNSFTLNWKKNTTQKDGYILQYSKNKNFSGAANITIKGSGAVTKTISGKKISGKIYVRLRAYKKVSGKTYYSDYTKVMSVTVKK